jgi:hypothetical protein
MNCPARANNLGSDRTLLKQIRRSNLRLHVLQSGLPFAQCGLVNGLPGPLPFRIW